MENLSIYEAVKEVPQNAQKPITGGRMNGKTDINPMWRIKVLTEQFGPCGFGWKYEITDKKLENGPDGEVAAFVDIDLYVKWQGEWSEAIPGTGGNTFVVKEKNGLRMSDECFKMALTDAISVACKALGVGALVYWDKDATKYDNQPSSEASNVSNFSLTEKQINRAYALAKAKAIDEKMLKTWIISKFKKESLKDLTKAEYDALCGALETAAPQAAGQ